jgi:hypothetical protein
MRRLIVFGFLACLFVSSCKKEKTVDEVTYEVTLTNASTWHGSYLDKDGQVIGITAAPNNWTYTFKNNNDLAAVTLQAYADGLSSSKDAVLKIYVNGSVVVQSISSVSPQVQYVFP